MLTSELNMMYKGKTHYMTKERIKKPMCEHDYNSNMGLIERSDIKLANVECVRKITQWYKKVFLHLLDLSILNAHVMFSGKTDMTPTLP